MVETKPALLLGSPRVSSLLRTSTANTATAISATTAEGVSGPANKSNNLVADVIDGFPSSSTGPVVTEPTSGDDHSINHLGTKDKFMVGDHVCVNRNKGGKIRFLGETKFAAGEWAGVVLDDLGTGETDGSVAGLRYFQCEQNRGVFVRLDELSKNVSSEEAVSGIANLEDVAVLANTGPAVEYPAVIDSSGIAKEEPAPPGTDGLSLEEDQPTGGKDLASGIGDDSRETVCPVAECVQNASTNASHKPCSVEGGPAAGVVSETSIRPSASESGLHQHLALARVHYAQGNFCKAERELQRGLHLCPSSAALKFNLGLVLKAQAILTLKNKDAGLLAIETAVDDLLTAEVIFKDLLTAWLPTGEGERGLLDEKRLRKALAVTSSFLNQSASHLERAERMDSLAAKTQKQLVNLTPGVSDQFTVRKNGRGKREVTSGSSSGTKGKMARQQARATDYSPLKKRTHKNAQLDENIPDLRQVVSNAQPQRKRVKAIAGDINDRRRRRVADRKRRELEIERITVSSDDDFSPRFRPPARRRRCVGPAPLACMLGQQMARLSFDESSDEVCSSCPGSDTELFAFTLRVVPPPPTPPLRAPSSTAGGQLFKVPLVPPERHDSISQKRGQSSSEKVVVLKRFLKAVSDEAIAVQPPVASSSSPSSPVESGRSKRNLSDGDAAPSASSSVVLDKCLKAATAREPKGVSVSSTTTTSYSIESDDSAKRHNSDVSEPESRKRKGSLHLVDAR
ncbi:putative CAP-Gly domain-containing linker protein 1 [Hypsibius exemplaris]|uniref:CAP-Gly domain-containing linker protein 1 n=1 Tax=Hypsibius exemplaris TaxID=2072580 RepID=A0A1W0X947_HYPEX|nr:putative CAP-Gly domain-containing linker protein 1 [Hypsibius exemplaris]